MEASGVKEHERELFGGVRRIEAEEEGFKVGAGEEAVSVVVNELEGLEEIKGEVGEDAGRGGKGGGCGGVSRRVEGGGGGRVGVRIRGLVLLLLLLGV